MKNKIFFRFGLLSLFLFVFNLTANFAQMGKISFGNAFNMLNSGNKNGNATTQGSVISSIISSSYTKKVTISYGIPISIVFEYIAVKLNLNSDVASDPDVYNNSSSDVQQAFDNLIYSDFVKISD